MEALVVEAIESCLRQVRAPDEILVVDNASSDNSVQRIRDRFGEQVRVWVQPENVGMFENLSIGFRRLTTDYGKILCADDLLHDHALKEIEQQIATGQHKNKCISVGVCQKQASLETGKRGWMELGPSSIPELLQSSVALSLADVCFHVRTFNDFGGFGKTDVSKDFSRDAVIAIKFIHQFGISWTERKLVFERPHLKQNRRVMPRINQIEEFVTVFRELGIEENPSVRRKVDFVVGSHLGSSVLKLLTLQNIKYFVNVSSIIREQNVFRWRQIVVGGWYCTNWLKCRIAEFGNWVFSHLVDRRSDKSPFS